MKVPAKAPTPDGISQAASRKLADLETLKTFLPTTAKSART